MADESEKIVDAFLQPVVETNKELTPPPKSDEQTVAQAAADDTAETSVKKAARKGNKAARKMTEETDEEKAAREAQEQAEAEAEAERERQEANKSALQQALEKPSGIALRTSNWLSSAPTPGGIGMLLLALLFFLWVIVPVNAAGDTRMKLLWYTLIGRTQFTESTQVSGGSADFGNTSTSSTGTTGQGNGTGPDTTPVNVIFLSPFDEL